MDKLFITLPPGTLAEFQPCSFHHLEMNDVTFVTKDETVINHGHLMLRIEPLMNVRGHLSGFTLAGAHTLMRDDMHTSMPRLLMRAFTSDFFLKHRSGKVSTWRVLTLYAQASFLLLRHPGAWKLS